MASKTMSAVKQPLDQEKKPLVAIVGNPNVGKSVLFSRLTGRYATASNYPGTTVELLRGSATVEGQRCEVVDTPGMYSLLPVTEEEKVARDILANERPNVVVHVVDARNLARMLSLTLELVETGLPLILAVNMLDEAASEGMSLDLEKLEARLGLPVVGVVAVSGEGFDGLRRQIAAALAVPPVDGVRVEYASQVEERIAHITANQQHAAGGFSSRTAALLQLQGDAAASGRWTVGGQDGGGSEASRPAYSGRLEVAVARRNRAEQLLDGCIAQPQRKWGMREQLSRLTTNPLTGLPILLAVLYFGLYKFVGGVGAGTAVDFLEGVVFEQYVNPFLIRIVEGTVPWAMVSDLFVGEYGILTLGLRYAVAIILPIVAFFFLIFAVIEDSGYLPRLALLLDRTFKKIGLSGRGVIPMVLGFGCDTMATMVTRTLPTRRERFLSTMLLALAIPCSAQLGVILALLEKHPGGMLIWVAVVIGVFLVVGWLAAKVVPGEGPSFYMEVPPLRLPQLGNVLTKTYVRVRWYFLEIVPMFILASVFIWLGTITHVFDVLTAAMRQPMQWIGLPAEAAEIFLLGFFRRDYGAAGLYDLDKAGLLTGVQLVVACVALTLFLPCVAQLLINIKERGWRVGAAISAMVLVMSFGVAYSLNAALVSLGVTL
jgi:ferrous iron transport protein B